MSPIHPFFGDVRPLPAGGHLLTDFAMPVVHLACMVVCLTLTVASFVWSVLSWLLVPVLLPLGAAFIPVLISRLLALRRLSSGGRRIL